jgi:uncharacterized membrane protein YphA (DoxX/SURF4 family)
MFPSGTAGWGLLLLRVSVAGTFIYTGISNTNAPVAIWQIAGFILLAGAFCLGAFTPVVCCASTVAQAFMLLRANDPDLFQFAFSFSITAVLFLLGPGAFSLDSHLFGRRLIVHSGSK